MTASGSNRVSSRVKQIRGRRMFKPDDEFYQLVKQIVNEVYQDADPRTKKKMVRSKANQAVHTMTQELNSQEFHKQLFAPPKK